jgi:hypothetical protein
MYDNSVVLPCFCNINDNKSVSDSNSEPVGLLQYYTLNENDAAFLACGRFSHKIPMPRPQPLPETLL